MHAARRRTSLRESFSKFLLRKSTIRSDVERLKGRYLFRAACRLVLEYINWIVEEPAAEEVGDDVAINVRIAQQKKVEKKVLTLEDRSMLLTHPKERTSIEKTHIFELFKKLRAFKKYSEELREALAGICLYQYFPSGRVIVRQGRMADNLYFIVSGEVSISKITVDDWTGESKEVDMGILSAGDIFGEIALLHIIPRSATAITKTVVDLLLIPSDDFNSILRSQLMAEWDILQDALVHFNYFKAWDEETMRECCILSKLVDFQPDEVLLGDGKGMVNYVHFVLEGKCRLIEHIQIREQVSGNDVRYTLYNPEETRLVSQKQRRRSSKTTENDQSEADNHRESINYSDNLLTTKPTDRAVDGERASIVTTTLLDVVNQWHEITEVAALLMREPSSISQQYYPSDVRTIFMQICMFQRGACFGLGENMVNRRIVSVNHVRCFLIPRYWLREHNRANIWERVRLFMDSRCPNRKQLFQEFVKNRKWMKYKENLVNRIIKKERRSRGNVTIHDVPYSIRINNDINLKI